MSLYSLYEMDNDLEKGGVILKYDEGVRIKIARAGGSNKNFAKTLARITNPYIKHDGSMMKVADEVSEEMLRQVYAEAVIKDWEGVTDRDGNLLDFTVENCMQVLKDLPELFTDIRQAAEDISNFRLEQIEGAVKN